VRKCVAMNIRSAIDSCDEQDFIYCLTDGFEEMEQEDLDKADEKEALSNKQPELFSGSYIAPCLLTLDVRHFATMLELDYQPIKQAISGVNSKIILDGEQQATLILDNYQQLGRQPTAHGNKIMFFSFPKFNKSNKGEDNYEMLVERQSQELYEIVTNKNEVYQWEVLTGRLLSCTIDDNLHLKKMKTSRNMPQHFSSFSVGVVVKDTDTEVLEYEEKGFEETPGAEDNTIFMVTIDKRNEKMQKKLTMAEKTKMRKAKLRKLK